MLLLATGKWVSTARLAMALAELDCPVELMCLRSHPALWTSAVRTRYAYNPLTPLGSVREAIERAQPLTVVAVDELAVAHLREVGRADPEVRALIDRSLGGARVLDIARSRMAVLEAAQNAGVRVPTTVAVRSEDDLDDAVQTMDLPLVLKSDGTSGGRGVRIADTLATARKAWRLLHNTPSFPVVLRRALWWNEWTHFRPWMRRETHAVSAQRLVRGTERTAMAIAHGGDLLTVVCMEVEQVSAIHGPSSILRLVHDAAMEDAIRKITRKLGLTGFCGFDFMVEQPGSPLLIEVNVRPTQLVHLPLGPGRDLVAAYARSCLGMAIPDRDAATDLERIALFPQEVERDPTGEHLSGAFHDVPQGEQRLIMKVLGRRLGKLTLMENWRV